MVSASLAFISFVLAFQTLGFSNVLLLRPFSLMRGHRVNGSSPCVFHQRPAKVQHLFTQEHIARHCRQVGCLFVTSCCPFPWWRFRSLIVIPELDVFSMLSW